MQDCLAISPTKCSIKPITMIFRQVISRKRLSTVLVNSLKYLVHRRVTKARGQGVYRKKADPIPKLRKDRVRISELKGMKSIVVKLRRRNRSETVECTSSGYFEMAKMHAQGSFFCAAGRLRLSFRCQDSTPD